MPLCSNCGKENRDGSRFCQSCGTPMAAPDVPKTQVVKKRSSQEIVPARVCSSCGTLNAPGMKFCKMCGSPLEATVGQATKVNCPSCGGQTPSGYKFCQHCGTPLPKPGAAAAAAPAPPPPPAPAPASPPSAAMAAGTAGQASLTTPAGASPIQAQAVIAASRPAPISPSPLRAALDPAADLVGAAASTPPDQAKTIIEMNSPRAVAVLQSKPAPILMPNAPLSMSPSDGAKYVPAAAASEAAPISVSGSIQTPATPPSGMAAGNSRSPGKPTVGHGAAKSLASGPAPAPERRPLARVVSVNRDGSDGEIHAIDEESFDLGRTEGQLVFNDDPYLSERHCRFSIRNGRWQVQDLESRNGIFSRVTGPTDVHHGDRLLLGKQVLVFELLGEHERALSPAVEQGVLVFGSPLRTPWGRLRQATVAGIYRDVYYLYRPRITIGREEGDWLFPDDEFMSRQHLTLSLVGSKVQLQDLQSSNGTFVQIREPQELSPGTLIRVGDQLLRFEPV